MFAIRLKHVEANGVLGITGLYHDKSTAGIGSRLLFLSGEEPEQERCGVPMMVEDEKSSALADILRRHCVEE